MKNLFQKLIKENKLAHGYLFYGENEKARNDFVEKIIVFLEKSSKTFFDTFIIDLPAGESIGIDKVREIKNFLWQKPIRSPKKTVVIKRAENLTEEAQNAILKITEEPPSHALIALLTKDPGNLAITLASRFQKIYISARDNDRVFSLSVKKYVADFLKGPAKLRREAIKDILAQENALNDFVELLMLELNRDPKKNWRILKELLRRWTLICQYNVNKRLQLEAFARIMNNE